METTQKIALVLTIVGAINWGAIGLFDFNIVEAIFGTEVLTKVIYVLVGLAIGIVKNIVGRKKK